MKRWVVRQKGGMCSWRVVLAIEGGTRRGRDEGQDGEGEEEEEEERNNEVRPASHSS